jgi:hypothetical protein
MYQTNDGDVLNLPFCEGSLSESIYNTTTNTYDSDELNRYSINDLKTFTKPYS